MPSYPAMPLADIEVDAHGESIAPRTRHDPAGTCRRTLAAAIRESVRGGLAGARVDVIARCTETNERMLHHHYDSKEKLFLTVLEHTYFRLKETEEQVQIESSDPREAAIQLVRFVWNFYYEDPELVRLLNSENLHEAWHLKISLHLGELANPVIEMLRGVVERGRYAGILRSDVDVSCLYLTISALGYHVLSNRYTISTVVGRDVAFADEHEAFA